MTHGDRIKKRILDAGLQCWPRITLRSVGRKANLTHTAVNYHFPDNSLKPAVIEHAIKVRDARIVRQLIASEHEAIAGFNVVDRKAYFQDMI